MSEVYSDLSSYPGQQSASNVSMPEEPAERVNVERFDFARHPLLLGLGDSQSNKAADASTSPMVFCRVCNSKIPLEGYDLDEHFIVKCSQCKEATPIRPAPHGERYVRCVCNCLLICRQSANKVACPRLNCQRIITVVGEGGAGDKNGKGMTATQPPPGTCRITCAHCQQPFIFNIKNNSLVKCPCCGNISAVDDEHHRDQMRKSIMLSVTFFILTVVIIFVNALSNHRFAGDLALNPLLFTRSQWSRFPNWVFKAWKVILALYFISWLVVSLEHFSRDYPQSKTDKWMVYLTHWTYLLFTSYLLVSAINACAHAASCGRYEHACHTWAFKFQWLLWNIAAPATTVVVLLYWSLLWPNAKPKPTDPPTHTPSVMNIHVHLLNGLILLLDQAIHAIPMRLLHVYQPVGYGAFYAAFTGVYFVVNGTDPLGETAIYGFLDYRSNTKIAIGADLGVVFVVLPSVWVFLWVLHKIRVAAWKKWDPSPSEQTFHVNPAFQAEKEDAMEQEMPMENGVYVLKM
ncbi:putative Type I phosphatidylinositol 4,5-bisphosphate 4-phosphatase-B [Hypsibius exemplaris]|uniref:phosphatidylinositol-4,5-bisphosphate 4-phosphatase n=1 Tax=Hypsibius exemplaris TaxID=2072580 RepID=A0A1W0X621_HYPEX|nr:putative Type I phosphatidylinositol 4,5-bisphosphate 4-phosphatase-B [Hypsibius exemplaris]